MVFYHQGRGGVSEDEKNNTAFLGVLIWVKKYLSTFLVHSCLKYLVVVVFSMVGISLHDLLIFKKWDTRNHKTSFLVSL